MQKKFKKRGFLVWSVVSTVWSCGKISFFFGFFCAREIIFFWKSKNHKWRKKFRGNVYALVKGCCALHKCNAFALMHSKECNKNFPNHHYYHHPQVTFFHFRAPAGFSLSWPVGNISLYLAAETFPTGNHQCKSWSQLKKQQAHKVKCSKSRAADLKRCKCCCNLTAVLFSRKSFLCVLEHKNAHAAS